MFSTPLISQEEKHLGGRHTQSTRDFSIKCLFHAFTHLHTFTQKHNYHGITKANCIDEHFDELCYPQCFPSNRAARRRQCSIAPSHGTPWRQKTWAAPSRHSGVGRRGRDSFQAVRGTVQKLNLLLPSLLQPHGGQSRRKHMLDEKTQSEKMTACQAQVPATVLGPPTPHVRV